MEKLYKIIVFFVGLIAMNLQVQAQLDRYSSVFFVAGYASKDAVLANYYHLNSNLKSAGDWAGVSNSQQFRDVTNFINYPNPAETETTIAYTLSERGIVNLRVIDLTGKQLLVLVKQEKAAGKHEYFWQFSKNSITSGMYILVLQVGNKTYSRKMIVQ